MCTLQEYDRLASQTVQNMLNDVDAMLYDPSYKSRGPNPNLVEECASWTSAFPHMRYVSLPLRMATWLAYLSQSR